MACQWRVSGGSAGLQTVCRVVWSVSLVGETGGFGHGILKECGQLGVVPFESIWDGQEGQTVRFNPRRSDGHMDLLKVVSVGCACDEN